MPEIRRERRRLALCNLQQKNKGDGLSLLAFP